MIKITVNTRQAILEETELLTTNSVGIPVQFTFSEDWAGLSKVAVFRAGEDSEWYDIVVGEDNTVDIPWELMTDEFEGEPLFIGAFGETAADHVIAIPTIWISAGAIKPGARSGNAESADPTPTQWSQIRMLATTAAEDAESAQQSAESAQYYAEHGPIIQDNYWYTWNGSEYVSTGQKAIGEDGDPGKDGVSPLVSASEIEGGHHIEITDAETVSTFNVMDGDKGDPGDVGPSGIAVQPTEPTTSVLAWMDTSNAIVASVPTTAELTTVDDKVGDGVLVGFDPLDNDLTKAANSLKNTLNQLDQNMAYVESGNTASRTYAAGDFISWKGTLYKASTAIPATTAFAVGTNLTAVVDGNNALCGGLNSLKNSFAIDSGNGYCKMPDGTLIQWGRKGHYSASATSDTVTIEFPIPFGGNYNPSVTVTGYNDSTGNYNNNTISISAISQNDFTVIATRPTAGYCGGYYHWQAIGRWKAP